MSLINDALKKTQRMRSDPADSGSAVTGGSHAGPRGRSGSDGPPILLMVTGGIVLVVLAVVGTVLLLRSKSTPETTVASVQPASVVPTTAPAATTASAQPGMTSNLPAANQGPAPMITLPKMELAPTPVQAAAKMTVAAPEATAVAPSPTPAAAAPAIPAKAKVDVAAFIDAIHVTGVRFSEGSSKVLMNDHVYKVNDVVERVLNIKLVEVGTDTLTFVDENGTTYKKNF